MEVGDEPLFLPVRGPGFMGEWLLEAFLQLAPGLGGFPSIFRVIVLCLVPHLPMLRAYSRFKMEIETKCQHKP